MNNETCILHFLWQPSLHTVHFADCAEYPHAGRLLMLSVLSTKQLGTEQAAGKLVCL